MCYLYRVGSLLFSYLINPIIYSGFGGFREGISPIRIGYPWGFIDLKREIIIKPKFNNVGDFSDGYVWVENSSGLLLLDKKEKW